MNRTPLQDTLIRNTRTANLNKREAKKDARVRADAIVAEEIAVYQRAEDQQVRLAFEAGIPKTQIAKQGLGTTAVKTVDESLARTDKLAEMEQERREADPLSDRYEWDTEKKYLTVTLAGIDLEKACDDQDWTVAEAIAAGVTSAIFQTAHEGQALVLVGDDFLTKHGKRHPVVPWLYAHEAEALKWYAKEGAA